MQTAYQKQWYAQKKQQSGKFCTCGKQIIWKAKRCKSCASKERSKKFPPPNRKGKQAHLFGNKFREGLAPINKGKHTLSIMGENHWNWKGGISPRERKSLEYKLWRRAVFEKDNYTCQKCGKRGGYLEADHIKEWADYPELRFIVNNGQTLCLKCHREKSSEYMKNNNFARKV